MADLHDAHDDADREPTGTPSGRRTRKRIEWSIKLVEELELTRAKLERATRLVDLYRGPDQELDPPPLDYLAATRTPQRRSYEPVELMIDGARCIVGLQRDRSTAPDPLREADDWKRIVDAVRDVRTGKDAAP